MKNQSNETTLGADYHMRFDHNFYGTLGVRYHFSKENIETRPNFSDFINRHNYISMKIGVSFMKF
ncbi:hypothetical protein AB4865_01455 [Capnocytophaga sp. ARDL2]|uniref:hypothetical protein n=1 Tax=Capnocytophaga sp. ARDL2 TaxID=3238809 RepID=UPI00355678D2